MSGTLNNIYNNVNFALQSHSEAMYRLQEQASTGSRINRVSDDSSTSYRILGLNSQERSVQNYIDNLTDVIRILELSSTVIENMASAVLETKVLVTQISSGIHSPEARERTANGINEILEQMVMLANTKHLNQNIFGGGSTSSAPYVVNRTNGEITSVAYHGSYENRDVQVAPSVVSSAFYVGDSLFRSDDRQTSIFLGDTGARAGTGTSSVRGDVWLSITGSAGNYTLSIDDGATTFNTDGTDTNLAVTHSVTGEVLYVDTTEISSTGVDLVSVPGTYDIFKTLITLRDILKNEKSVSDEQVRELLDNSWTSLEEASDLLLTAEVSIGSRAGFLDDLKASLQNVEYNIEDEVNRLQEADIAQIAIDLSRRETLYQISLSVAAKLMSTSLIDFIR